MKKEKPQNLLLMKKKSKKNKSFNRNQKSFYFEDYIDDDGIAFYTVDTFSGIVGINKEDSLLILPTIPLSIDL